VLTILSFCDVKRFVNLRKEVNRSLHKKSGVSGFSGGRRQSVLQCSTRKTALGPPLVQFDRREMIHICFKKGLVDSNRTAAYIAHMSRINGSEEISMDTTNVTKGRRAAKTAKAVNPVGVNKGVSKAHLISKGPGDARRERSFFATLYRASPLERISLIREGVAPRVLVQTGEEMGIAKERMFSLLRFTRATVNRRIKSNEALPTEYSERIIGLQKLIGQVEIMVAESGDPTGFNAAHWVAEWLERPVPALNNAKPADFMDTIEGQELVSSLLAKMRSGAYA
jgi:putative toxin-antitoxin system antitoxin component (TIGR02293 family)